MVGSDISAVSRHLSLRYRRRMSCSLGVVSSVGAILEHTTSSGVGCGVSVLGEEVYDEIKARLGIDFVPNLYRVMAQKPEYLEASWNKVKAVMVGEGKLDRLTKEVIAVAVSAVLGCRY